MTSVDSTSGKNVARTMGFYTGIVRTGSIIGVSLGAILFDFIGFTQTFLLFGIASLFGVPLGRIARRNLPTRHSDFRRPRPRERLHHVFPLLVCGFVSGCVIPGIITATLGYVLKSRVGESVEMLALILPIATINGIFLALRNIINTAGAPAFGLVVDRIGYRRAALIVSSMATVFLVGTSVASTPYMVVLLLGVFVCGTCLMVVFNAEAGRRGSRVNAAYVSSIDFGAAVGPMIGWYMIALIPSPTMIFAVGAALYAIATVFSSSACRTSSDTGMSDEAEASEETGKEPIQF